MVTGGQTATKDIALDRNWASKVGGASIDETNDDLNGPECDPDALIDDQDQFGWAAYNPSWPDYPAELSGDDPSATIALPDAVDVSSIGIDPAPGCFFLGASAALKGYRLEVSSNGTTFTPYAEGEFTPEDAGSLNRLEPLAAGAAASPTSGSRCCPRRTSATAAPAATSSASRRSRCSARCRTCCRQGSSARRRRAWRPGRR